MRKPVRVLPVLGFVALLACGVAVPASARVPNRTITVIPRSAMVATTVTLIGSGFAPDSTLTIQECGARDWVVPQQACASTNAVTVTTDRQGRFRTAMTAAICPFFPGDELAHPTERRCFVGIPQISGIDTERLVAATKLIVSWP